jgi:hypothetical protein
MQVRNPFSRLATAMFVSAALFAAPAAASSGDGSSANVTTASASKPAASEADKKICVSETKLGSRVARRVCRTAAEWELENQARAQKGFDPHQRF